MQNPKFKNIIRKTIQVFAVALFMIAAYALYNFLTDSSTKNGDTADNNSASIGVRLNQGKVLGEEQAVYPGEMRSDKMRVPQVGFGGGLSAFYPGLGEPLGLLDIEGVESELVRTKNKKELEMLVRWNTKRPTKCSVEYGKAGGQTKMIGEENFSLDHSAIFSGLESSSTYNYNILATDKLGGEARSDKYAFFTGAPEISFLDLIAGAFKNSFGWAMKK